MIMINIDKWFNSVYACVCLFLQWRRRGISRHPVHRSALPRTPVTLRLAAQSCWRWPSSSMCVLSYCAKSREHTSRRFLARLGRSHYLQVVAATSLLEFRSARCPGENCGHKHGWRASRGCDFRTLRELILQKNASSLIPQSFSSWGMSTTLTHTDGPTRPQLRPRLSLSTQQQLHWLQAGELTAGCLLATLVRYHTWNREH